MKLGERDSQGERINFTYVLADIFKRCGETDVKEYANKQLELEIAMIAFSSSGQDLAGYLDEHGFTLLSKLGTRSYKLVHILLRKYPALYEDLKKGRVQMGVLYGNTEKTALIPKRVFFASKNECFSFKGVSQKVQDALAGDIKGRGWDTISI